MITLKQLFPCVLACSISVLTAVACSNDSDKTEPGNSDSDKCVPECADGKHCVNGTCVENEAKTCDPECADGKQCVDGECVENTEDTCSPECEDGKICRDGECVNDEVVIEVDTCSPQCKENQICNEGTCIDNEEPAPPEEVKEASFQVTPVDGLVTVQNIVNAEFSVILGKAPLKDVILPLKSNAPELGALSAQSLTFTTDNWDTPQKVTITATTEAQENAQTPYTIVVGTSHSDDKDYNELKAVEVHVTHHNQYQSTDDVTLSLNKTEAKLFLRKVKHNNASASEENSITLEASLNKEAKDQNIFWKFENMTDDVDYTHLIDVTYDNINESGTALTAKIVRKEYDLNSDVNLAEKLDLARTIKVTVSHAGGKSVSATIELKPYLAPGFSYTYISKHRDSTFIKPLSNKNKGDFECGYYDEHTTYVLNYDMMHDYVEPKMYKAKDGKLYPTRASVLAAARFIVTQFPRDIAYTGQNAFDQPEGTKRPYTHSSYIWAKPYDEGAPDIDNYRLYGFNFTEKGYNSPEFTEKDKIEKDGIPWNCSYVDYYKQELKDDGKVLTAKQTPYNGLRCTGFVTWAMRNGRFGLGDVYASVFAQKYPKSAERVYSDPETTSYFKGGKKLLELEELYEKLNKLKESDFVFLSDLDSKNSAKIKAGDILWYLYYSCKAGQKCPEECKYGGGHFGLVLGITYNSDKTVKYFYVAEGANRLNVKTVDEMKQWGWIKQDKGK
ncbi:MAG: hypothetical protein J6A01_11275, partial [Proteobacteria bacterium]|nr:hypothetical protein [Pseudomonadota bacterium]